MDETPEQIALRAKPLILTYTGRRVNPLAVRKEDVCEQDVAHHLALINRFNGATMRPISVAQHAVYVSRLLDGTGLEWQGLHHDDGEAYVGDVTKWLKESPYMDQFRNAEARAQVACYEHFGVHQQDYIATKKLMHPLVEAADKLMLRLEGERGFGAMTWNKWLSEVIAVFGYKPLSDTEMFEIGSWQPWTWRSAEIGYHDRLRELRNAGLGDGRSPS